MLNRTVWFGFVVVLSVGFAGCQSAQTTPPLDAETADETNPGDTTAVTIPEVVARVNGTVIGREEFERAVRAQEIKAGQVLPPSSGRLSIGAYSTGWSHSTCWSKSRNRVTSR